MDDRMEEIAYGARVGFAIISALVLIGVLAFGVAVIVGVI